MADNANVNEAPVTETSAQRIKRALASGRKERISKNTANTVMLGVFRVAAAITTLVLLSLIHI